MQKRATNLVLTGVTGTFMAGMLVAGVAAASGDDSARQQLAPSQQAMAAARPDIANQSNSKQLTSAKKAPAKKAPAKKALLTGTTTASYFWDDGSGINGDTGAPAGGKPMQKGLFASPSWPLHTKVRVTYDGRSKVGFIGDRGPGKPSHNGVMLDLDTYTFRYLLDGKKPASKYNAGTGEGHLKGLKYEVLEWGSGPGKKGKPQPFGR
ncbi:hypothetical protein GCM10023085_76100 [Actinomadura viridis]|uniref:Uncharacterized protein n=1 Tax=Actinomadura viridis TaxID=58110 RepID=A0A931DK13_9ACTN|nr:hypothetical protein [Actinomadura viridis]MBG6088981.1 hypothetical protein [Actinomadura viridis]